MNLDYQFIQDNIIDNITQGYIASSKIDGFGLFAKNDIKKGEILCVFDGQVISWEKYHKIQRNVSSNITPFSEKYFFMEWNALDENTLLVRPLRTKYSYINHSRIPNVEILHYPLRLVAIHDIQKHEEITLDYRQEPLNDEYIQNHGFAYL
jgi:SET domain-containing protein